jgi:hypothetical protein
MTTEARTTTEVAAPPGFLGTLVDLWFEPGKAFDGIVRRPRVGAPLLAHLALVGLFTGIWWQKVDPGDFMKTQLVEQGRWDRMPPEARERIASGSGGPWLLLVFSRAALAAL